MTDEENIDEENKENIDELNELRGIAERLGAEDFINVGDIIRDNIDGKWVNPSGAYNVALRERLTAISLADDWKEAKLEWKATGNIWYVPMRETADDVLPEVHQSKHPHECICGHKIAWHFEILNTENDILEIVGSEHIGFWMIARHLLENLNIPADMITQERVKQWTDEAVKSMKAEWWWNIHGEQFEEWFNELSETDLRVNVRDEQSYWDEDTNRYEHQKLIRKKAVSKMGEPDYGMASIVWRWNHPDNTGVFYTHKETGKKLKQVNWLELPNEERYKTVPSENKHYDYKNIPLWDKSVENTHQKETRGWPNDRLWADLQIFYFDLPNQKELLAEQDRERAERVQFVIDEKVRVAEETRIRQEEYRRQEVIRREERRLEEEERLTRQAARDAVRAIAMETALEDFCEKHNLPEFTKEDGSTTWEQTFLGNVIPRIKLLESLSPKQINRVIKIINKVDEPATEKQLAYIRSLGGEPNKEMTKRQASDLIGELKNPPKVEITVEEEE